MVFAPGMMCDERLWAHQIERLDVAASVADLSRDDNFADMADRLLAAAPPQFALAGLSMGGILAFEVLRRAPERVTHLALLDTNPYAETPQKERVRSEQMRAVAAGRLREITIDTLKPLYLAVANRGDRRLRQTLLDMALSLGPEVFQRQARALLARADSSATLAAIRCPTRVICGREDTLCPVEWHERMAAAIPGASLLVLDGCGHVSALERPAAVADELARLLSRPQL